MKQYKPWITFADIAKGLFEKTPARSKDTGVNETEYLLKSPKNAERILRAVKRGVEDARAGRVTVNYHHKDDTVFDKLKKSMEQINNGEYTVSIVDKVAMEESELEQPLVIPKRLKKNDHARVTLLALLGLTGILIGISVLIWSLS